MNLLVTGEERDSLLRQASRLPSIQLSERCACDLEMLACGAFSPLDRFMNATDYHRVVGDMRLDSGHLFAMPITLRAERAASSLLGKEITLRTSRNDVLAVMKVEEFFECDPDEEAWEICATRDLRHPLVAEMQSWGDYAISGPLAVLNLPFHPDFHDLRQRPREVRQILQKSGSSAVIAFQTRNPMHRAHEWITKTAAERLGATLLIQPAVGLTKPGDIDHVTRIRCIQTLLARHYPPEKTLLNLIPLAMRFAGPREAVWHALIRRNYGASHFIVGRDHASPGVDSAGRPFYGPIDAQILLKSVEAELGVTTVPFGEVAYLPEEQRYDELGRIAPGTPSISLSGTQVREYLADGIRLPEWFTRPEVAEILSEQYRGRPQEGFCVWLTGLPAAGKSTVAEALTVALTERGRTVTLLDGDKVRTLLSAGLGFSKEDRDANVLRIAYVASEIVRHHGAVVCAAVSPYEQTRVQARNMVGEDRFVLVHVATPLPVCQQRDQRGLYERARNKELQGLTGVDDPYQPPPHPHLTIDNTERSAAENADRIIQHLVELGFLEPI